MTSPEQKRGPMPSTFFALVSRMKYIERWALMRSARPENLSEHSLEVAMIAHALATIANVRYGRSLDASRAAVVGLFHDASEIITGDMPTPVKYYDENTREAYKSVESAAIGRFLDYLPAELRAPYEKALCCSDEEHKIIKAADKLCAYIKCLSELELGNREFKLASESTYAAMKEYDCEELDYFLENCIESFGKSLDELKNN